MRLTPARTNFWNPFFARLSEAEGQADATGFPLLRVGDYRILCQIKNGELPVLVAAVGRRRGVYE